MVKHVVGGVFLGAFITIAGALLVGPDIKVGDIGSGNRGSTGGRYDFRIDEKDGAARYTMIDKELGVATVVTSDGKTVTVKAPETPAAVEAQK